MTCKISLAMRSMLSRTSGKSCTLEKIKSSSVEFMEVDKSLCMEQEDDRDYISKEVGILI